MMVPEGTPLRPEPFLVIGSGPAVYLLDDPQCPVGGDENDPVCPPLDPTWGTSEEGGGESSGAGEASGGNAPTEGWTGSEGGGGGSSGGGGWSSGGGEGDPAWDSGPALPPGYGETGCALDRDERGGTLLVLVGLWWWRRRRSR
jgi:hypothetical protein